MNCPEECDCPLTDTNLNELVNGDNPAIRKKQKEIAENIIASSLRACLVSIDYPGATSLWQQT